MTKELFDKAVAAFIKRKGNISKIDFARGYNKLPSIHYVRKYYGDLNSLKKAFGIEDYLIIGTARTSKKLWSPLFPKMVAFLKKI